MQGWRQTARRPTNFINRVHELRFRSGNRKPTVPQVQTDVLNRCVKEPSLQDANRHFEPMPWKDSSGLVYRRKADLNVTPGNIQFAIASPLLRSPQHKFDDLSRNSVLDAIGFNFRDSNGSQNNTLARLGFQSHHVTLDDVFLACFSGPSLGAQFAVEHICDQLDQDNQLAVDKVVEDIPTIMNGLPIQKVLSGYARSWGYRSPSDRIYNSDAVRVDEFEEFINKSFQPQSTAIVSSGDDGAAPSILMDNMRVRNWKPHLPSNLPIDSAERKVWFGGKVDLRSHNLLNEHPHGVHRHAGVFYPIPPELEGHGIRGSPEVLELLYALLIVQTVLGGGSQFTTGGPGSGMTSWLYKNVLTRYHGLLSCSSVLSSSMFSGGVFGYVVSSDATSDSIDQSTDRIQTAMTQPEVFLTEASVAQAIKQLMVRMYKMPMFSELEEARLLLVHPTPRGVDHWCSEIKKMTVERIYELLKKHVLVHEPLHMTW